MIRLFLLAFLLLNLQAKTPPNHKDTPFFRAFKALKAYMIKSYHEIDEEAKQFNHPYSPGMLSDNVAFYVDKSIPLAQAVAKQVPLFKAFKPRNKREAQFLAHVQDMEMLHAIDIMDDSYNPWFRDYDVRLWDPKNIAPARKYLEITAFYYAPLFNAQRAGLDVIAYLKELPSSFKEECNEKSCGYVDNLNKNQEAISKNKSLKRLAQDIRNTIEYSTYAPFDLGLWTTLILNETLFGLTPEVAGGDNSLISENLEKIDPEGLRYLYRARLSVLGRNASFYTRLKDNPTPILKDHPTMCLSPKYLSPKSQQACLQLFQAQTYNTKDIQDQLHLVRLISIDDSPCVYLNASDKLQLFKSSNALCLALQTNLKKE
ncbi:hypothetical protein NHP200010_05360 [Helicobacter bizzozeronii]|uniref:tRNA methyltransferase n=1 Tax=Helicobacter bizzozeronii TaxID=56877 RepID=UPI00244D9440|nr:tRNA methyltransferase [Helicobacter bizzozeronii]GMB92825.1 hypothetical protein NHP200010_05360 [Helicobacter bizzozeronii]